MACSSTAAQQFALVEAPLGIDALLVRRKVGQLIVGDELELGDADAMFARNHAIEPACQTHDASHGLMRGLQHVVVIAVDRDVGVHVAITRVHVQRNPDPPMQDLRMDFLASLEDRRQGCARED